MKTFAVILAMGFSSCAWAQTGELWFDLGRSLISNSGIGTDQSFGGNKDDVQLTDGFRFGFRFGFNQGAHYGHELQYAYNRTQLKFNDQGGSESGMAIHQGGYNFLYYLTPDGFRIRPFGTGGIHFNNYVPPGASVGSGGGETKVGFNYGVGVKVRVGSLFGVRFDLRQYVNGKPFGLPLADGLLRQTEVSAGFGIGF
jgi:Outer membrane protein beta-barrel domain